ncbi:hypothetical protein ACA910_008767 [Epithemia clementina (nom. ined.)]
MAEQDSELGNIFDDSSISSSSSSSSEPTSWNAAVTREEGELRGREGEGDDNHETIDSKNENDSCYDDDDDNKTCVRQSKRWRMLLVVVLWSLALFTIERVVQNLSSNDNEPFSVAALFRWQRQGRRRHQEQRKVSSPLLHGDETYVIDYSCVEDYECAIKDVGDCCGGNKRCVSSNFVPDYSKRCQDLLQVSVCGHVEYFEVDHCICYDGECAGYPEPLHIPEPLDPKKPGGVDGGGGQVKRSSSGRGSPTPKT